MGRWRWCMRATYAAVSACNRRNPPPAPQAAPHAPAPQSEASLSQGKATKAPTQSRLGCRKLPKPLIAGLSETGTRPGPPHMNRDPYITMASAPWAQAHENARSKAALTSLPSLAVSHREIGAAEWCSSVRLFSGISFLANSQQTH